ncbi:MAG: phenylacetic acid degradation protein [Acidobacteria bacterium]|nr:MAG: phenylacetic acid degradation protein [Acidobacteriota bacterium]
MEKVKRVLAKDSFNEHCGIKLLEVAPGYARSRMEIQDRHLNGLGIVHGGAIFTLADFTFGAASNSHGQIAVGINATISYAKAVSTGVLIAEAKEVSLNHKLGTYVVEIRNDKHDLIAIFQGTVYRKKEKF